MAKIVKDTIKAKGIDIGIYTEDFQNEFISLRILQNIKVMIPYSSYSELDAGKRCD